MKPLLDGLRALNAVDITLLAWLGYAALQGMRRGLVNAVLGLAALGVAVIAAAAGAADIKEKLREGVELNGRKFRNYIDGYNMMDYLTGKSKDSPRKEFIYVN